MKHLILALLASAALLVAMACQTTDVATPEEAADRAAAVAAGDQEAVDKLDQNIAQRAVGVVTDFLDPFVPIPLQPFIPLLGALFFKRPRRLLMQTAKGVGSATKNLATGKPGAAGSDVGGAIESMLQTIGLADSRNDTIDDLAEWSADLRTNGQIELADTIDAKIADLTS